MMEAEAAGAAAAEAGIMILYLPKAVMISTKAAVSKPNDRRSQGVNHDIILGLELP